MTNKEAISNLEQLYPLVSETMKRSIDTAIESLENEPRNGYWEAPDPDYDRDGERIPIRVAICSECQKPNRLPVGTYCTECGSRNKHDE